MLKQIGRTKKCTAIRLPQHTLFENAFLLSCSTVCTIPSAVKSRTETTTTSLLFQRVKSRLQKRLQNQNLEADKMNLMILVHQDLLPLIKTTARPRLRHLE